MDIILQMALKDWRTLNQVITAMTEDQLNTALETEKSTTRRQTMMIRIHQRLSKLRIDRERKEIIDMSMS